MPAGKERTPDKKNDFRECGKCREETGDGAMELRSISPLEEESTFRFEPVAVLVVEDSDFFAALVEDAISGAGIPCSSLRRAKDGSEAVWAVEEEMPDIVVLDWEMPGIPGTDIARAIRRCFRFDDRYVYILMATGRKGEESFEEALASGVDDYIAKPFSRKSLIAKLRVGARIASYSKCMEKKRKELESYARIDMLTGLYNRKAGEERLLEMYEEHRRKKRPLGIMFADLDGFKQVNDTYGHETGDEVLRSTAAFLKNSVRVSDIVSRWGGDEFVILFPECGRCEMERIVERMGRALPKWKIEGASDSLGDEYRISMSAGCFSFVPVRTCAWHEAVKSADDALYEAKRRRIKGTGILTAGFFEPEEDADC